MKRIKEKRKNGKFDMFKYQDKPLVHQGTNIQDPLRSVRASASACDIMNMYAKVCNIIKC